MKVDERKKVGVKWDGWNGIGQKIVENEDEILSLWGER